MTLATKPYNPFDYLETKEEINEYLNNAYMDDDPRVFLVALGYLARKQGMSEVARKAGLNRESLYKALAGEGNPRFSTVSRVIKALGADWLLREFSQPFLTQGNPPVTQDHPQGAQDNPLSPSPFSADGEIPQLILIIRPLSRWDFPYANFQLVQYQADNAFSNSS